MTPLEHSVMAKSEEHQQMASYHDMSSQPRSNETQCHSPIPVSLPYSHFAVIYIDHRGEMQAETSPSIAGYEEVIFTEEVQDRFLKVASGEWQPTMQGAHPGLSNTTPSWYNPGQQRPAELIPFEWQASQSTKRQRHGFRRSSASGYGWEPPSPSPSLKRSTLRVGQTSFLRMYYDKAFLCFQQLNCRVLAKAFVKRVEPRKQVNHPYNGRKTIAGETLEFDPEKTKPKWWPTGVTHREPDHLCKAERIRLLVHILCELRNSHGMAAEKLREAGQDVRRQITPAMRLHIMDEIFYVRGMEELYLDGKISADTPVHVSHVSIEDELQAQMMSERIHDLRVTRATAQREQQLVNSLHGDLHSEDTYCLPVRRSKRPADSDCYLSPSASASPSVRSRNGSQERSISSYSSEMDPAVQTKTEARGPAVPRSLPPMGPTSVTEYFAAQFAPQPASQNAPGLWDTLPNVHPQFAFTEY
ncbi:hypothetical protein BJX70DRAFT_388119 [Aspergillus crustosus]